MKIVTIEFSDNGYKFKGLENIESRSESIWVMLAARHLEDRALRKGYLPDLEKGLEERIDKSKDKVRLLTEKEHENIGVGDSVPPTYLTIELPKNVPSNVKPIVILPNMEGENVIVKVTQYGSFCGSFESKSDLNKSQIINLNTGV
ncbi:hypothetical protein [Granulicatella adiacens]|jgi:ALfa-l-rhamnosidase|uniref:hypothetical protein n=1 Tax=Granulicatella adiacens TaxID=46124 RepID=UPI001C3E3A9B|nr:hypothetical protein [Granulicatella adiacens]DAN59668.1 MAG TPA: hypothetical protein [Caudoviricetes sp.]DAR22620.1 MAG TPA: hypothetical protein [Caudoviricetes sp.]